jgi:hypothetical protein
MAESKIQSLSEEEAIEQIVETVQQAEEGTRAVRARSWFRIQPWLGSNCSRIGGEKPAAMDEIWNEH